MKRPATYYDAYIFDPDGTIDLGDTLLPSAGETIIQTCTNTKVEAVVGKPSAYMAEAILGLLAMSPEQCIITGDRLSDLLLEG